MRQHLSSRLSFDSAYAVAAMTDRELLVKLDIGFAETAGIIGVKRQVLHRAVSETPPEGRRGVARKLEEAEGVAQNYLNADRLLAMWRHFFDAGNHRAANLIRDEIAVRHPRLSKMISPYEVQPEDPDEFQFHEVWILSVEPLELHHPAFRQKMGKPLKEQGKRLVYFVPSDDVASELLTVLRVAADGKLKDVFIVVTAAVLLCPHWFIAFIPTNAEGHDQVLAGVLPDLPEDLPTLKRVVRVPETYFRNVQRTLMQAGLLDARDRFKLPPKSVVGGGAIPQFRIFYPDMK